MVMMVGGFVVVMNSHSLALANGDKHNSFSQPIDSSGQLEHEFPSR